MNQSSFEALSLDNLIINGDYLNISCIRAYKSSLALAIKYLLERFFFQFPRFLVGKML